MAYGLVLIWALVGIAVKQSGNPNIVMIAQIGAIIVAVSEAATILLSRFKHHYFYHVSDNYVTRVNDTLFSTDEK